jgi:hypothetical protein
VKQDPAATLARLRWSEFAEVDLEVVDVSDVEPVEGQLTPPSALVLYCEIGTNSGNLQTALFRKRLISQLTRRTRGAKLAG